MIFKGLLMKHITQILLEGESPTLTELNVSLFYLTKWIFFKNF